MQKKTPLLVFGIFLAVCLIVGATLLAVRLSTPSANPLPDSVQKELTFSALVIPEDNEEIKTSNARLASVEDGTLVLSYALAYQDISIAASQYPQPSQFNDVEGYRERFLENVIQQTSSVSTAGGTVYLGQMAKQENKPLAVLLERGLILLMTPDQSLSEDEWRRIGDSLVLVKPSR